MTLRTPIRHDSRFSRRAPLTLGAMVAWALGAVLALGAGVGLGLMATSDSPEALVPTLVPTQAPTLVPALVPPKVAAREQATVMAQLAAYGSAQDAQTGFARLQTRHAALLGEFAAPDIEAAQSGGRAIYRLRVGPFGSQADAKALCAALKARKQDCLVRAR